MITLSASGGSVTFTFSGNSTYLNDGQITVPVNSLALIIDESDMATFRKAASNDIFVSANIAEFGMTKDELMAWYKANMVGSTGGGGGVTSGEVQTMIDESISGKADSSDVYTTGQTSGATEIANALNAKLDATAYTPTVVDAALSPSSTNPVQNQALYGELRVGGGTSKVEIDFNTGGYVPEGVTQLEVNPTTTDSWAYYNFYNGNTNLGSYHFTNWGSFEVGNSLEGSSYVISGETVIITYPASLGVTRIAQDGGNAPWSFKAIVETPAFPLKDVVSGKVDTTTYTAYTASTDAALSGKVDTEDLDISGKTLYVGDYHSGYMPYELAKEYPISTKPTKLLVKRTDDGNATNVTAFQLYFDNGTTSGSCILRVSSTVGSGITEAAWQVETPEASLELVNGEVYITFLNGYYLTMFKPATYIQGFVMQIVTDIESGSTPSVVESGIYNALDKMSETLTDVITKSDAAYYRGIGYPSLSYSSSGITFSSSAVGVGVGINTATTSVLATDASIGADNGVLGVYTTGNTHAVNVNPILEKVDRCFFNSIPSNIKMYWNSSYTGNTTHYIRVNCIVNDGTDGVCVWDWKNGEYVPNTSYVNTAVTLTYDSTNQVVTITPSSSSALTSINYVRCNRYIAPSSDLTEEDCLIGAVTIDTNSYKLQEALDNKVDTNTYTAYTANTQTVLNSKLDATAYTPVQVSSAITENDTNAVAGGALWDELRIENAPVETTLTFRQPVGEYDYWTTNYPSGCTTLVGNILASSTQIELYNNSIDLGGFVINCYDGVLDSVTFWGIEGTYSISGSVVTISYPNTTNVTRFRIRDNEYQPDYQTYKAMATVAPTVLKNQVNDNTTALGGLKLQQISQSDYDNLPAKDASTLYVII